MKVIDKRTNKNKDKFEVGDVSEEHISAEQHKALVDQMIDNLAALFHRINESNELKITATESKFEEDKMVCEFTFPKWFYVDDLERRYKK